LSDDDKIIPFRKPSNGANGHPVKDGPPIRVRIAPSPSRESDDKPSLAQRLKGAPITVLISVINIGYFLWIEKHGSSQSGEILLRFGAVQSSLVRAGDYWRIASYMIVHIGWAHLLMNTWAGGSWCIPVERALGTWRFLLLYLLAGIGGGAAVVIFSDAVTAGASGAMFGIIGALLTIRYRQLPTWKMFINDRGVRSTVAQIALWTVLGIVALPMSQAGHFGGLLTGAAFLYALTMPREKRKLGQLGFAAAFIAFVLFAAQPWAKNAVDWSKVQVSRVGLVDNPRETLLQATAACGRGVERACVVKTILEFEPAEKEGRERARKVFEPACAHGDKDACAGLGIVISDQDFVRGSHLIREACAAGSEWGCEFAVPDLQGLPLDNALNDEADASAD
jgi:rhomboid protease GluP